MMKIGDNDPIIKWIQDLARETTQNRVYAIEQLKSSKDVRAIAPLMKLLKEDKNPAIITTIETALACFTDDHFMDLLSAEMGNTNNSFAFRASLRVISDRIAVSRTPSQGIGGAIMDTRLLQDLCDPYQACRAEAIGQIENIVKMRPLNIGGITLPTATYERALVEALADSDSEVRLAAAQDIRDDVIEHSPLIPPGIRNIIDRR